MPFGLKNIEATYQRLVAKMFQEDIGKSMGVYVGDMLVKTKKKETHILDLNATSAVQNKIECCTMLLRG